MGKNREKSGIFGQKWAKIEKNLGFLVKTGQKSGQIWDFGPKMVEKNRLFFGFLAITSSRLEIALCKGARLWNLRTRPTFSYQLIMIILCVGGAPDLQKTPFFQPEKVTLKRWLPFHHIKLFDLKFWTYTKFNPLHPKKRSFRRSDIIYPLAIMIATFGKNLILTFKSANFSRKYGLLP